MKFLVTAFVIFTVSLSAQASELRLKGMSIGEAPAIACRGQEITDQLGDIVRRMASRDSRLVNMNTNECEVPVDTFGGYTPSGPARLVFFEGRLILVRIMLEEVPMKVVAEIVTALQDEYGKAKLSRSSPFTTHTWTRGHVSLTSERTSRTWDDNDLIVILRDEVAYKRYDALFQSNKRILDDIVRREARRSVTN